MHVIDKFFINGEGATPNGANTIDVINPANPSVYDRIPHGAAADVNSAVAAAKAEFNMRAPFGGFKQSGNGRELGSEALREYFELKAIHMPTTSA
ncbi:aldehyde dehydrogenase family protein [Zhongshania aquimaris]|uniref:Aldehyde dehydrogenase family protein n=1 Tax=Zhongshania aquimaris TaxID=2857107 RepID=A0ABS6VVN8_9GAMM|nr:aldehyde dehydrogenase family protein [Zhongshania aquimaris]MBW2942387.1 aldehyde dehydrogenase family protein [Zhongshania aquimaris]